MKKISRNDITTDYLQKVYVPTTFSKAVDNAVKKIKTIQKKTPFEAIAFTGTSGAAFAYAISYKLQIPLICVRKKDRNHYLRTLEGYLHASKYLIIDDFIAEGVTVNKIISSIKKEMPDASPVGIMLYADDGYYKSWNNRSFKKIPVISLGKK